MNVKFNERTGNSIGEGLGGGGGGGVPSYISSQVITIAFIAFVLEEGGKAPIDSYLKRSHKL